MEQKVLTRYDKLWKMMDDCIANKEFTQIPEKFTDGKCGRCINGVIISYYNGYDFDNIEGSDLVHTHTNGKVSYNGRNDLGYYSQFQANPNRGKELLKECYEKEGYIHAGIMASLNNKCYYDSNYVDHPIEGWSFEDFRDFFKELDA